MHHFSAPWTLPPEMAASVPPPARNYVPVTVPIIPSGRVVTQWSKCERKVLQNTAVRMRNNHAETSQYSSVSQDIATLHGISRLIALFTKTATG